MLSRARSTCPPPLSSRPRLHAYAVITLAAHIAPFVLALLVMVGEWGNAWLIFDTAGRVLIVLLAGALLALPLYLALAWGGHMRLFIALSILSWPLALLANLFLGAAVLNSVFGAAIPFVLFSPR